MSIAIILDIVVLTGLVATIFYAMRLSRQFENLQKDKAQLERLIESLSNATNRADVAVKNMRDTAIETGEGLQGKINLSRALFDELEIMIEAGDNLAERLQVLAERSRKASGIADDESLTAKPKAQAQKAAAKSGAKVADKDGEEGRSRAEKELLEALKAGQTKHK